MRQLRWSIMASVRRAAMEIEEVWMVGLSCLLDDLVRFSDKWDGCPGLTVGILALQLVVALMLKP
jgi:hypothetical protein